MSEGSKRHEERRSTHDRRQRSRRADGRSLGPEPRHPLKHALNPPIVTIFGGGVAGLTAAHELVERGFYVQLIEQASDPYRPGCPIVGGMAANQPARVRANLEDLHDEILAIPAQADGKDPTPRVAGWLLRLFAFNRSRWVQSESPEDLQLFIDGDASPASILEPLRKARKRYKDRWLWDLIVRACMIGTITRDQGDEGKRAKGEVDEAFAAYDNLVSETDTLKLAIKIRKHQDGDQLPSVEDLEAHEDLVRRAFEREFLCFRLVAPSGGRDAIALREKWRELFLTDADLSACCLIDADQSGPLIAPPPGHRGPWLAIDVIEQRLPGEHGFRFFPSFYNHLEDTMKRIPLSPDDPTNGRSALDNLRPTVRQGLGLSTADIAKMVNDDKADPPLVDDEPDWRGDGRPASATVVELLRNRPSSIAGFRDRTDRFVERIGGTQRDAVFMFTRLLRFMMSSPERRKDKYETMSWARFMNINELDEDGNERRARNPKLSKTMIKHVTSAAQALLAFSAEEADARSYGNIAVQMLLDELGDGTRVDRTLNGPTSDAWLEPWRRYLQRQGVRFFQGSLDKLEFAADDSGELIPRFTVSTEKRSHEGGRAPLEYGEGPAGHQPDFYVLALNVERTQRLLMSLVDETGVKFDDKTSPDFKKLIDFGEAIAKRGALKDMTGVQFFFDAKTSIGRGHMYFPYTEWGLSSISQSDFWNLRGSFADGYADVLSVEVCTTGDFDEAKPGDKTFWGVMKDLNNPNAEQVDQRRLDVAREVWEQLRTRIEDRDKLAQPRYFHVDQNIRPYGNVSKFLASMYSVDAPRPGTNAKKDDRNEDCVDEGEIKYSLNFNRWVMCGTFMATHTRLTTMESANESARHAVKTLLGALELDSQPKIDANIKGSPPAGHQSGVRSFLAMEPWIDTYQNKQYNGAAAFRVFDPPDIFDLEDRELEDLDFFRRVDRRLHALGLPHMFDIIDFDRKVEHALDAMEIYKGDKPFRDLLGLAVSNMDALLVKELGLGHKPERVLGDVKGLIGRFKTILDALGAG